MYFAIVFLPLIGFLIAGAISLVGARGRHPGGLPPAGAEDHARDHGPHHAAPAVAGGGVIHASHHEAESHEPAAMGSQAAGVITT
ncbi:MAG TPA: NADH-quinone oxidoreductase subunit L, partial [Xanthobacteraceae bacterium]|nr:NADH-quinone oxidoreductase subunit L [Xanthobacteraceae bacterium]